MPLTKLLMKQGLTVYTAVLGLSLSDTKKQQISKAGTNKGKTAVRGKQINRDASRYRLEIPCQYIFYGGTQMSLPWLKSKRECLGYSVVLTTRTYKNFQELTVYPQLLRIV